MIKKDTKKAGFTLIELLVVLAIVGILASGVLVNIAGARTRAKRAKAQSDLHEISKAIQMAQINTGLHLGNSMAIPGVTNPGITTNYCSDCNCRPTTFTPAGPGPDDLRTAPDTGICYQTWATDLDNIQANAGIVGSSLRNSYGRDPWGSPYLLDENEYEGGTSDCRVDRLLSAGPDGNMATDGDNISLAVPHIKCPN